MLFHYNRKNSDLQYSFLNFAPAAIDMIVFQFLPVPVYFLNSAPTSKGMIALQSLPAPVYFLNSAPTSKDMIILQSLPIPVYLLNSVLIFFNFAPAAIDMCLFQSLPVPVYFLNSALNFFNSAPTASLWVFYNFLTNSSGSAHIFITFYRYSKKQIKQYLFLFIPAGPSGPALLLTLRI